MQTKSPAEIEDHDLGLNFEEFSTVAESETIISNWIEILADLDTPVSIYAKLQALCPESFLLESVEGGEKLGRYSIIGFKPLKTIQTDADGCYKLLEEQKQNHQQIYDKEAELLPFFHKGYVGYLSFETVKDIETSLASNFKKSKFPEMYMIMVGSLAVFDHVKHKLFLVSNTEICRDSLKNKNNEDKKNYLEELYKKSVKEVLYLKDAISTPYQLENFHLNNKAKDTVEFQSNTGKEEFMSMVEKAKEHILEGDIFQVVLSHILKAKINVDPLLIYRILRTVNPSPYLFLFNAKDKEGKSFSLVGSSPEMLVKNTRAGEFVHLNKSSILKENEEGFISELRPIAGTYKRGKNEAEDKELSEKLLSDKKERAEHVMLVDLARNDLGRVCTNSSIEVPQNMIIEKYSHVLHIVSSVIGKLAKDKSSIDLLKACFPAGTLSGAPKVKALEIISKLEKEARGPYGGCLGNFSLDKSLDVAMVIRTLIIEEDQVSIQAGAGVVADSEPEKEYQETLNKASALMRVINLAV